MLATDRVHLLDKWSRNYFPFSMEGVVLYLPLWQEDMQGTPLISYDHNHESCAVVGAAYNQNIGRLFDGTDDHIVLPANWLPATGTISLWIAPNTGAAGYMLSSDLNEISIYHGTDYFNFYYNGAGTGNSAALAWATGVYHNIIITYGVNLNSIYYRDGGLITGGGACGAVAPTNVATWLGEGTNGTSDFAGTMAEATFWKDKILTPAEVKHYYNNSYPRRFQ